MSWSYGAVIAHFKTSDRMAPVICGVETETIWSLTGVSFLLLNALCTSPRWDPTKLTCGFLIRLEKIFELVNVHNSKKLRKSWRLLRVGVTVLACLRAMPLQSPWCLLFQTSSGTSSAGSWPFWMAVSTVVDLNWLWLGTFYEWTKWYPTKARKCLGILLYCFTLDS